MLRPPNELIKSYWPVTLSFLTPGDKVIGGRTPEQSEPVETDLVER